MRLIPFATGVAGGIAIAAAAYTGYWFLAAEEIEEQIAAWADEQRAQGVSVQTGEPKVSGFPLRFEVDMTEPEIDDPTSGWGWRGRALKAHMRPWNFSQVTFRLNGINTVRYFDGEEWRTINCAISDGIAYLTLDGDREISDIALEVTGLEVDGIGENGPTRIERLRAHGLAPANQGPTAESEIVRAAFDAEGISLPAGFGEELGESIEFLNLNASLRGPMPHDNDPALAIAAWRDGGGTLELDSFRVRWGPLGIESNGTIALDGEMRPIGALTADIIGYGDVIDALIMSNMIPLGDAFLAKVAFNMLAEKPEDGPPVLRSVPVTVQNGGLFVGPVAVAKVPPLEIPDIGSERH